MKIIRIIILLTSCLIHSINLNSQKQISITVDDPNTYSTPILSWNDRNDKILSTFEKHKIQAALFVCGMRVDDENGNELLKKWDKENHLICNHSYSHLFYHSSKVSINDFISDFLKGDSIISGYHNYTKLFRFPYLKEGSTAEKRDSMRVTLKERGYGNGHVTVDASDWYIDSRITEHIKLNPDANLEGYKRYYINHIIDRIEYYDSLSLITFKRRIPHTLLLHHNLLNALFLDDLLLAIKNSGWELIDAKKAYTDEVYNLTYEILPCGESLVWQSAKDNPTMASTLRYPAEDGRYEKEKLNDFIRNINSNENNQSSLVIHHQIDNYYVYTTCHDVNGHKLSSNGMYLVTEDGVVLFDPPRDTTQLQLLLEVISTRHKKIVAHAIATYYHDDMRPGLEFLRQKGVKTYSSKLTFDLCRQHNEKHTTFYFNNDTTFNIGNYKFETYHPGQGHTKDNILIWFNKYKILYAGCLVKSNENNNLGDAADVKIKKWKSTIKKVTKKHPRPNLVIPDISDGTTTKDLNTH